MEFNIDKAVKLTKIRHPKNDKFNKFPLEKMTEGDSIFVPFTFASRNGISNYISNYKKKTNTNFVTRAEKGGIRIFKLA